MANFQAQSGTFGLKGNGHLRWMELGTSMFLTLVFHENCPLAGRIVGRHSQPGDKKNQNNGPIRCKSLDQSAPEALRQVEHLNRPVCHSLIPQYSIPSLCHYQSSIPSPFFPLIPSFSSSSPHLAIAYWCTPPGCWRCRASNRSCLRKIWAQNGFNPLDASPVYNVTAVTRFGLAISPSSRTRANTRKMGWDKNMQNPLFE